MTSVACFCGYSYCFEDDEGACPRCRTVAVVRTSAIRQTSHNSEQTEPDPAAAGESLPATTLMSSGR